MEYLNYAIKKCVVTSHGKQSRSVELMPKSEGNLDCLAEDWDDEYQLQPWV